MSQDPAIVTAELRFRWLFQAEMDARGWGGPDIVMELIEQSLRDSPGCLAYRGGRSTDSITMAR